MAAAPARGGGGPGEDGVSGSRRPFPRVPRKKAFGEQLGNWPSWSGLREACGAGSEVTTFQNGGHMVDLRIGWRWEVPPGVSTWCAEKPPRGVDASFSSASFSLQVQFSSVQFSRSVVSDSLQPPGWQHTRPPCPSPTPGVYSNSCPLSR